MIPQILKQRFWDWTELEHAIAGLGTTKEQGDALEAFAYFYLRFFALEHAVEGEPEFPVITGKAAFSKPIRDALSLGTRDYGIDGVFRRKDGALTAVQCKFRRGREALGFKQDLATFWADAELADYRLVFTNSASISPVARRRPGHLAITIEQLLALDGVFFEALHEFALDEQKLVVPKKKPRPYQEEALRDILAGFATAPRGKLTAACGIGKTLIALWAAEARDDRRVLFIAPNLQLIRQTLREWALQASEPFRFLAVCSDDDIGSDLDEMESAAQESEIPTTTDADLVRTFLEQPADDRTIVLSTYQSLPRVVEAVEGIHGFRFDIALFDEAHRTAGSNLATGFSIGLDDAALPAKKRLFMTATERLFAPRALARAEESGISLFSMDQMEVYGPSFHSLSFRQAIEKKIIAPYEVIVAAVPEAELRQAVKKSQWVRDQDDQTAEPIEVDALLAAMAIGRVIDELEAQKVISFHSTIRDAKAMAAEPLLSQSSDRLAGSTLHINGAMTPGIRAQIFSDFAEAERALLTNVRCLVEGVDIPMIDAVCFVTPKTSLIDIVQAIGRALRKPWGDEGDKVARVVVPVAVGKEPGETDLDDDRFQGVFNVIQAIREQDEALADVIDDLNLQLSRGRSLGGGSGKGIGGTVKVLQIENLDLAGLAEALQLRVATVNARPGEHVEFAKPLGAGERKSTVLRLIRTLGDYTPEKLNASLVQPTLERFPAPDAVVSPSDLRVNNNNVAHARKLGVTRLRPDKQYELTALGRMLQAEPRRFADVMRNQLLLYEDASEAGLYPYRLVATFVASRGVVTYWDFLFGIYNAEPESPDDQRLASAADRLDAIEDYYAALEVANEKTRAKLVSELNAETGLELKANDIWTDRTTAGNQFRYFGAHLALYEDLFEFPEVRPFRARNIRLVADADMLNEYLVASGEVLAEPYGDAEWWRGAAGVQ